MSICVAYDSTNDKIIYITEAQKSNASLYKCLSCDNPLILKSGEKVRQHFVHKEQKIPCILSPKKSKNNNINEGETHKQAKFLSYNYLNKNGKLKIVRKCDNCDKEKTVIELLKDDNFSRLEFESKLDEGGIADLVLFRNNGERCIILEIMDTHRTKERAGLWCELDASEIIKIFTSVDDQKIMVLYDISKKKYNKCTIGDVNCLSLLDIAEELGYVVNYNKTLIQKIGNCTENDNSLIKQYRWFGSPDTQDFDIKDINPLWGVLINKSKCLHCKKKTKIENSGEPYCTKCLKDIRYGDAKIDTVYQDLNLREKYLWLKDIPTPECDLNTWYCLICNNNQENYISFYDYLRPICLKCINTHEEKCWAIYKNNDKYKTIYDLQMLSNKITPEELSKILF